MRYLPIVAALVLSPLVSGHAVAQCAVGVQIADSCSGFTFAGCCTADNMVHWCENGVVCELDCAPHTTPTCGWLPDQGFYDCGQAPEPDPSCANSYSCLNGGCLPTDTTGCCGCACETCVCDMDSYCCETKWDSQCVDKCKNDCDGCGSVDGCQTSNSAGCDDCSCEACVCAMDAYCCTVKWDDACTQECVNDCGGECVLCVPDCAGKECGDDGCGESCGSCPEGWPCQDGICVCTPECVGKECGDDSCSGSCGACPADYSCNPAGQCIWDCTPDCAGQQCGDDGCGGSCGECAPGWLCNEHDLCEEQCLPDCSDKECGDDSCSGSCGECFHPCTGSPKPALCVDFHCDYSGICCPECADKECGDDSCSGSCGECEGGLVCQDGVCVVPETGDDIIAGGDTIAGEDIIAGDDIIAGEDIIDGDGSDVLEGSEDAGDGGSVAPGVDSGAGEVIEGQCPPGQRSLYGKCVAVEKENPQNSGTTSSSGCSRVTAPVAERALTGWFGLFVMALLGLWWRLRRLRPVGRLH